MKYAIKQLNIECIRGNKLFWLGVCLYLLPNVLPFTYKCYSVVKNKAFPHFATYLKAFPSGYTCRTLVLWVLHWYG